MQGKPFRIYRSSAGSGKTYTLAQEYLQLALRNPQNFRQILAVTYTNKAMQEMKSRIIANLFEISQGADNAMTTSLKQQLGMNGQALCKRANSVLSAILHDYSFFAVSTIDSFFQKVIRSFTREIGLHTGFKLELDQGKVLSEVIDKVIGEIGEDKQLTNWLVQFAEAKVDEGKVWDIKGDIVQLAGEIFKEEFKVFESDILAVSTDGKLIPKFKKQLSAIIRTFRTEMETMAKGALKEIEAYDLTIDDFSRKRGGIVGYFVNVTEGNYEITDTRRRAADNVEQWFTKTSPKKHLITQAFEQGLNAHLKALIHYYDRDFRLYQTADQLQKLIYTLGIIANITQKVQDYREEHDVMLISDGSVMLKTIIGENDAPFIYEKVGATYKNFLIDEFQDTSGFQWDNFKPLLQNSIAEGNESLVVGDIKQAIYRWRGGDWKLLLEQIQEDIGAQNTEVLNLNHNWRSKKNIIDFNNSIFNTAAQVLEKNSQAIIECLEEVELKEGLLADAHKMIKAYHDVFQQNPKPADADTTFQGYINMTFLPPKLEKDDEDDVNWREEVLERLPARLEALQRKGYQLRDICMLVRNRREGKAIADMLMAHKCSAAAQNDCAYEVISSESLQLLSARSIQLLMAAIRFIDNDQDTISLATLAHHYQRYVLRHESVALHELFVAASDKAHFIKMDFLPPAFYNRKNLLKRLPLFELVEELIRMFSLTQISGEFAYLQSFQDVILDFNNQDNAEVNSFLSWWDEHCTKKTVKISDSLNAMRILTIHRSKGLQFKVVLIPFCDWKLDHEATQKNIIWCNSGQTPFSEVSHLPLFYGSKLGNTLYAKYYYEEMIKVQMDALNLLYVAFTRAEECLITLGPAPKNPGKYSLNCISSLLYNIFSGSYTNQLPLLQSLGGFSYVGLAHYWKEEQMIFEMGEMPPMKENISRDNTIRLQKYHAHPWRNRLTIKRKAAHIFQDDPASQETRINMGLVVHETMAKIKTRSQLDYMLEELKLSGTLSQDTFQEVSAKITNLLNHPEVAPWFSGSWEVKTEVPVLPLSGEMKRLDRVMLKEDEAVVIDYKSSAKNIEDPMQVQQYVQLLREMGYKKVEGYLLYLADTEVVRVA